MRGCGNVFVVPGDTTVTTMVVVFSFFCEEGCTVLRSRGAGVLCWLFSWWGMSVCIF